MLVTIRVPDALLVEREIQSICVHLDGRHCHVSIAADIIYIGDERGTTHDDIRARKRALDRWRGSQANTFDGTVDGIAQATAEKTQHFCGSHGLVDDPV